MSEPDFYDELAPFYHLIYEDWEASVERQGRMLDAVIRELHPAARTVLDAACGIGTQALGLAALGYGVTASDLSPGAVERARREAARRGVEIAFSVADMREVADHHRRRFDVVLAGDNAVPHLLTDADILAAFRQFFACTEAGGVCLVSVRDYAGAPTRGTEVQPHAVREENGVRYLVFQVRDHAGEHYDLGMYLVEDAGGPEARTRVLRTRYYAVTTDCLAALMREAGFGEVRRLDGAFYQPLVVGRRPAPE